MEGLGQRSGVPPASSSRASTKTNAKTLRPTDVRFTTKNGTLYAFVMGWPDGKEAVVPTLALGGKLGVGKIRNVELLGHKGKVKFTQDESALKVELPPRSPATTPVTLKIVGA